LFTGIVQEVGTVVSLQNGHLSIAANSVLDGLELGASVAINGVCLTVTSLSSGAFTVDVVPETLRRSNLGALRPRDRVNLERALRLNGELGGHLVQGHIDDTGTVTSKTREREAILMRFSAPESVMKYVVTKGVIAIDGTSLTGTDKQGDTFGISLIPMTQNLTILPDKKVGDTVNLEADIIGKYVAEFLKPSGSGLTAEYLREHGFGVE